jgi:hypothetical protein
MLRKNQINVTKKGTGVKREQAQRHRGTKGEAGTGLKVQRHKVKILNNSTLCLNSHFVPLYLYLSVPQFALCAFATLCLFS